MLLFFILHPSSFILAAPGDAIPPLAPPLPEVPVTFLEQHGWVLVVGAIVALAAMGVLLWLSLRPKPTPPTPPEIVVRAELATLDAMLETGDVLSRVSQTLRRYVAAAFGLPPGQMNTTEFCAAIRDHQAIGADLYAALAEFLRDCDERKFCPAVNAPPLGAAQRALALVEQAEARRTMVSGAGTPSAQPPAGATPALR